MATYNTNEQNWQIIKDLWKTFGNNPRNVETFDALANVNPVMSTYRGTKTLSNVDLTPIKQSYINEAYGVSNPQIDRAALSQLGNIVSGGLDVIPAVPVAKAGAKAGAREIAKQIEQGTGVFGNLAVDPRQYITAYHGSPYLFNKFDPTKIGSGEGAQSFGYGLYFAENPKVAKSYQKQLADWGSPFTYEYKGNVYNLSEGKIVDPVRHAIQLTYHQGKKTAQDIAKIGIQDSKKGEPYALELGGLDYYNKMLDAAKSINKKDIKATQGALYKVDIADETIHKMLDWDKPLLNQTPQVQKALESLGIKSDKQKLNEFDDALLNALTGNPNVSLPKEPINPVGSSIYQNILTGSPQSKSARLQELGISGIRYLDAGSRNVKGGTSNYVVFDPDTIKILERNGLLLP